MFWDSKFGTKMTRQTLRGEKKDISSTWSQEQKETQSLKVELYIRGLFSGKACLAMTGKHSLTPLKFYTIPTL